MTDLEDAQAVFDYWATLEEIEGKALSQNEFLRRMNRGAQWIIDRKNLLNISDDLKPIAAAHQGVTAQMLAIEKTQGELRERLVGMFDTEGKKRAPKRQVEAIIAEWNDKEQSQRAAQSTRAPEQHTQERLTIATTNGQGSAPVSRGVILTAPTTDEGQDEIDTLAIEAIDVLNRLARTRAAWQETGAELAPDHRAEIVQALRANGLM